MSCDCNKSCGCRTVITKQGEQGVQGDPGPAGIQGPEGPQGPAGADGADGADGQVYEYFDAAQIDHPWQDGIESLIIGATHTITADGNYQVHVNISSFLVLTGVGATPPKLRLYVGGVMVQEKTILAPNPTDGRYQEDNSILWRGNILNTQTVEVRCETVTGAVINTNHRAMLINKES